jgi:endo-1,4-beta-xylanase
VPILNHLLSSRRDFLRRLPPAAAAVTGASAFAGVLGLAGAAPLAGSAAEGAIPFGAAVRSDALAGDPAYREALASYCRTLVHESDLKWDALRPTRGEFRFEKAERIAAFAHEHKLALRGHTLAWYGALPPWTAEIRSRAEAERELTGHIETVVSRFRGRIASWDVVNEPIPENPSHPGDLRSFVWSRHLGEEYIPIAFRAAAAADPRAQLVLNEYDVEFVGGRFRARREALLRIARRLKDGSAPLHAIGLQAHLFAERAIDGDGLQAFLSEVKAMGLAVLVTELDVIDHALPGPIELRDALVAAKAYEFLDAVTAVIRPTALLTWGISDRYTWVPIYFSRPDGLRNRPLPLDEAMRPKLLHQVVEHFRRKGA